MLPKMVFSILFIATRFFSLQSSDEQAIVRAVLFYSPACGHCHLVIQETLPPLARQYGEQLQIVGVDVTQPQGQALFESARKLFGLETTGVPFLVVGNEYLVGSSDIPNKFPLLIEKYLAEGGVGWPDIPGLRDAIQTTEASQSPTPTPRTDSVVEAPNQNVYQRVMQDPIGNGLSIIVLLLMVGILTGGLASFRTSYPIPQADKMQILIPVLCFIGLGVAGYLAFVESTQITAVCGPVGDCNTVQQSEYAKLFGIIPIGVLGMIGYIAILLSCLIGKIQNGAFTIPSALLGFGLSTVGIMFSIYLTFLEPFVIGATCVWCITSAIIMTALFQLTMPDAKRILINLKNIN